MGQVLNIEIVNGEKCLANCYYHWSAYSVSSLRLAKQIIEYYDSNEFETPPSIKDAVNLFEFTGAGINDKERELIKQKPEKFAGIVFKDATSRNDGLISVTKRGMSMTRSCEEGRVTIDFQRKKICFSVYNEVSKEDFENEWSNGVSYDDLKELKCDIDDVSFSDLNDLIAFITDNPNGVRCNGNVILWIM